MMNISVRDKIWLVNIFGQALQNSASFNSQKKKKKDGLCYYTKEHSKTLKKKKKKGVCVSNAGQQSHRDTPHNSFKSEDYELFFLW